MRAHHISRKTSQRYKSLQVRYLNSENFLSACTVHLAHFFDGTADSVICITTCFSLRMTRLLAALQFS